MSEPNLCPLRTIAYQPGCSTVAVRSRSSLDTGDETADVGEVVRQANVGHPAEGLEELIVGGDSNRAGPRGLEKSSRRVSRTERRGLVIDFWVAFSEVAIIVRRLVRKAWRHYRWETRPSHRP